MSYLQQILQGAQQRGGLTDDEFNSIFSSFMPQQPQQPQNMGYAPQPTQQPQMIPLAKQDNSMGMYGKEMATLGKAIGKKFNSKPEDIAKEKAEEEARKAKLLQDTGMNDLGQSLKGLFDFI